MEVDSYGKEVFDVVRTSKNIDHIGTSVSYPAIKVNESESRGK